MYLHMTYLIELMKYTIRCIMVGSSYAKYLPCSQCSTVQCEKKCVVLYDKQFRKNSVNNFYKHFLSLRKCVFRDLHRKIRVLGLSNSWDSHKYDL